MNNVMYTTKYQEAPGEIIDCLLQIPEEALQTALIQLRQSTYGTELYDEMRNWIEQESLTMKQCEEYFQKIILCLSQRERPIYYGAWLASLDFVLNRSYHSEDLYKEDKPILRCFLGNHFSLLCNPTGNFTLFGFNEIPKLQSDPLANNKLISRVELEELKQYEQEAGRRLTKTTAKKDVLHILKMGRNGLLGRSVKREEVTEPVDTVGLMFEDRIRGLL